MSEVVVMTNKEWHEQLGLLSPTMRQYVEHCIDRAEFLEYLESNGVDSWSGYEDAQEEYSNDQEDS
tara:strand:- start:791 stop:988 length:198 start_codon:yes stop_codon:yes gene_type:complete